MRAEYPYVYPHTHGEAVIRHEEELWDASFRENVCCARAIEEALRETEVPDDPAYLPQDCIAPVLEEYGFKRVSFVLAHTVAETEENSALQHLISDDVREWAKGQTVVSDSAFGRYYEVNTAIVLLNQLVRQTQEAYQALELFGREQCCAGMYDASTVGKVLVLSPNVLKESALQPQNQLWLASGGFGCDPKASGRAIYATCLSDGEEARWNREDFVGVLDEQYLPDWAQSRLDEIRAPKETHSEPTMSGIEMA